MLLLAHPTGNANVRAAAHAFYMAGFLQEFHSCICWNLQPPLTYVLPSKLLAQLQRRSFPHIPSSLQLGHPWRELVRLVSLGFPSPIFGRHDQGPLSIDAVCRSFDRSVARRLPALKNLEAVYGYEDCALSTFQAAQRLGMKRLYDLPIGYWRSAQQIFAEERELQPSWACTLTGLKDSPAKLDRKDQELALADLVVVPSQFVKSTLTEHAVSTVPIAVVPFGSPPPVERPTDASTTGPLRVLYVGSLGQRKGLSYALDAVQALGAEVTLTLIGKVTSSECRPLAAAIERYKWIPSLPHHEILEQMLRHDVLVLPSLFEGYALVINEALSQGLPVIATPNSGATEAVRNTVEGYIVPIRDSQAIAARLHQLFRNRDVLAEMRAACLRRAEELSWTGYEQGLQKVVAQALTSTLLSHA